MVTLISSQHVGGLGGFSGTSVNTATGAVEDVAATLWTHSIPAGTFDGTVVVRATVFGTFNTTAVIEKTLTVSLGGTDIAAAVIADEDYVLWEAEIVLSGTNELQMGSVKFTISQAGGGTMPLPAGVALYEIAPLANNNSNAITLSITGACDTADEAGAITCTRSFVEVFSAAPL